MEKTKKLLIVDTLELKNKEAKIPKKFANYEKIWDFREALLEIWKGNFTEIAIPRKGIPGYNFLEFIQKMILIGQIKNQIIYELYEME